MPHIHEQIDFTAETFVVYQNKVLLRKHDKYKMWLSVGGHVELHEDPNQAAIREVKEEVGLDITLYDGNRLLTKDTDVYHELIPPVYMNRHVAGERHEHVTLVYFARAVTDNVVADTGAERSEGIRWFTADELDDPTLDILDTVRHGAKQALMVLRS
jgi:8-oxo-dGTP pyrophosphatase MutT (NUDIX family)